MKFCILTQYYPPEMGAPQARLSDLARRLREQGHEVTVLTAMPNYPSGRVQQGYRALFRREVRDGVRVLRAGVLPTKSVGLVPRLASYFSFVASSLVIGALPLPRLDFLLTESPPLFLGIAGSLAHRRARPLSRPVPRGGSPGGRSWAAGVGRSLVSVERL
jgi:colanic acid biosynthesis glycosyl transferase WcaI